MSILERLHATLALSAPLVGISVPLLGDSATVRIDFVDTATTQERQATQDALLAFDWSQTAQTAWENLEARTAVLLKLTNTALDARLVRSLLLIILDEFNLHALKLNAILNAADSATTLATFKTAMAAIADYPQRTKAQLLTSLTEKINTGAADN